MRKLYTISLAILILGATYSLYASINRALPTANEDGTATVSPSRTGRYLEAYTIPLGAGKLWSYADEGTYYSTYNVTDGTGIASHAAPVQADLSLKPLLHIFNASATKRLYIDSVRLRVTAVGAGATTTDFTIWTDSNGSTVKTSGGTVATAVNCLNGGAADGDSIISFGAVVATAAATEKRIDHQRVRSVVSVVEDQYSFSFGNPGFALGTSQPSSGVLVVNTFTNFPPVVVPPGGNFKLCAWAASQSGAHSYEYSLGYVKR